MDRAWRAGWFEPAVGLEITCCRVNQRWLGKSGQSAVNSFLENKRRERCLLLIAPLPGGRRQNTLEVRRQDANACRRGGARDRQTRPADEMSLTVQLLED